MPKFLDSHPFSGVTEERLKEAPIHGNREHHLHLFTEIEQDLKVVE